MSISKSIISVTQYDIDKILTVNGWIDTARFSKKTAFIKLYDSWKTHLQPLQVVFDLTSLSEDTKQELLSVTSGCSITVIGKLVASPKPQQPFELQASQIKVLGLISDPGTYPIAKTELSMDYLRSYPHLECYSVSKSAIYGIRSILLDAINIFFLENDFTKCDMPLITFSECEGGCQPMQATLLLTNGTMSDIPVSGDSKNKIDFTKDFFGRKASLTVSSQLELETQLPLGNVWTMTRAVRGEPSATSRHLAEFSMLELEMPFIESAKDIIDITEKLIKSCMIYVLGNKYSHTAIEILSKKFNVDINKQLTRYIREPFIRITHRDAVTQLLDLHHKGSVTFETLPSYLDDMSSEHERYLTDVIYKHPVVVTEYPKKVKAFYMPVCGNFVTPDGTQVEYVDCFDILVPGVGELVGGSRRISDYDELLSRIEELSLDRTQLEFYLELRKYGSTRHGGMGMGFERLVKFITCVDSVKDCVTFPRYFKSG